jgi:hypothetical protein
LGERNHGPLGTGMDGVQVGDTCGGHPLAPGRHGKVGPICGELGPDCGWHVGEVALGGNGMQASSAIASNTRDKLGSDACSELILQRYAV